MTTSPLERRIAHLILSGVRFTADDVTADGALALDGGHTPNGAQSGIGSMFTQLARRGLIETTNEVVRSRAPHRKGGAIRVWLGTEAGHLWARSVLP
jgi:hypothetical protein